jgi:hypothetical protein
MLGDFCGQTWNEITLSSQVLCSYALDMICVCSNTILLKMIHKQFCPDLTVKWEGMVECMIDYCIE